MIHADTQAVLATPWGRGGIAVILLHGPRAGEILDRCFRPRGRRLAPAKPTLGDIVDADGSTIDQVIVALDPDRGRAEINCHGGTRVVQRILSRLEALGAPRGEDQAAGWDAADEVEAAALRLMPKAATRFVVTWLSRQAEVLPAAIRQALQHLEQGQTHAAVSVLREIAGGWPVAGRLLDPARIVLLGPANAGKSTLANALSGREGSIVTDQPGTTRDWVEHPACLDGIPVTLVDTAGLRATADPLEREALARTGRQHGSADLALIVLDATGDLGAQLQPLRKFIRSADSIVAVNKCDLIQPAPVPNLTSVSISALRGTGLDELSRHIRKHLGVDALRSDRPAIFTESQSAAIAHAIDALLHDDSNAARARLLSLLASPTTRA